MNFPARIFILFGLTPLLAACGCFTGSNADLPFVNRQATLEGDLSIDPLQWNVITALIDRRQDAMSILYGNDAALSYARSPDDGKIPTGACFALVTWRQQADPNWFGARIPGRAESVEVVTSPGEERSLTYQRYGGSPLKRLNNVSPEKSEQRGRYITSLKAAVMP